MLTSLTSGLAKIVDKLRGAKTIDESTIDKVMVDVRNALIDGDVALDFIDDFQEKLKLKALGHQVIKSVTPGQMLIKVIHDSIVESLSCGNSVVLVDKQPTKIMMTGLQGSGKTTTAAKIASHFKKDKKRVCLVSLDVYRPAAMDQLRTLAIQIEVDFMEPVDVGAIPIAQTALKKIAAYDVVIFDTAGRLQIDQQMMQELQELKKIIAPDETLFVLDSMTGQNAYQVAKSFHQAVGTTGNILTRMDGDAKGGAALSIVHATNMPIKFLGTGEKIFEISTCDPERLAARIFGQTDVVSFVEQASKVIDKEKEEQNIKRMQDGKFDLNDYIHQIKNLQKIGGIGTLLNFIPQVAEFRDKINQKINSKVIEQQIAIYNSMTKLERKMPTKLNASRIKRVANGSGVSVNDVNKFIKQYEKISQMMKKVGKMDPKAIAEMTKNFTGMF